MSIINYFFGYPGELAVPQTPLTENLKMATGVATASGYYLPRACTVASFSASWSAHGITDEVVVALVSSSATIDTLDIYAADGDLLAMTKSPGIQLGEGAYLNAVVDGFGSNTITDLHVTLELTTAGAADDPDDVLPNIAIATADLQTVKPNITQYLKDGETDFDVIVLNCKRELYGEIKMQEGGRRPDYTNDEMDALLAKVRDYPKETFLATRLKHMVVGWILMDNRLYEEGDYFIQHAKSIPIRYYIDDDGDSTADDSERTDTQFPRFGR